MTYKLWPCQKIREMFCKILISISTIILKLIYNDSQVISVLIIFIWGFYTFIIILNLFWCCQVHVMATSLSFYF